MAEEKPLRVLVAEALGHKVEWHLAHEAHNVCACPLDFPSVVWNPEHHKTWMVWVPFEEDPSDGDWERVPRYGEETQQGWACTGPLIQRFQLMLIGSDAAGWEAMHYFPSDAPPMSMAPKGAGPCEVLARLVVALHEAGRLR